jgi:hypothetical protein
MPGLYLEKGNDRSFQMVVFLLFIMISLYHTVLVNSSVGAAHLNNLNYLGLIEVTLGHQRQ